MGMQHIYFLHSRNHLSRLRVVPDANASPWRRRFETQGGGACAPPFCNMPRCASAPRRCYPYRWPGCGIPRQAQRDIGTSSKGLQHLCGCAPGPSTSTPPRAGWVGAWATAGPAVNLPRCNAQRKRGVLCCLRLRQWRLGHNACGGRVGGQPHPTPRHVACCSSGGALAAARNGDGAPSSCAAGTAGMEGRAWTGEPCSCSAAAQLPGAAREAREPSPQGKCASLEELHRRRARSKQVP